MTYVSADGAVIVPSGALDNWLAYRPTMGATRGDLVAIGDSTTYGSGGLYSWLQRVRARAVGFGMADGGKGMFAGGESLGITYDSPEVNGFVSTDFGGGFPDGYDNTDGAYFYDTGVPSGHTTVFQFRQSGARLWYRWRFDAGDFTYSVDGGEPVTVQAYTATGGASRFVAISGLAPDTLHTVTVTNLGVSTNGGSGTACYVAMAPINATGFAVQNFATSGDTISNRFYRGIVDDLTAPSGGDRYQSPFGLVPGSNAPPYTGIARDTTWAGINPIVGIFDLGFNDLTVSDGTDLAMWTEYVKIAAGTCQDAGCDCVIVSGQLPYNSNWLTYGIDRFNALKDQALASGAVFVDLLYPVAGPALDYAGPPTNPHLEKAEYVAQGDYFWDEVLALDLAPTGGLVALKSAQTIAA